MSKQMTIRDIAGFCPEEAIWKMIADVSDCLLNDGVANGLSPDSIIIDGNSFMVNRIQDIENEFHAPEHKDGQQSEEEKVWSLGAIAYYASTGHIVFGGQGGKYQKEHPLVSLPALPKGLQSLTPLLQKCLCYDSNKRIGLKVLNEHARKGMEECGKHRRKKNMSDNNEEEKKENGVKYTGEKWPEEMVEL